MRLGILADIHEEVELLAAAVAALERLGVDSWVTLGDTFDTGRRLAETVALLEPLEAAGLAGVWGNHDFGLCGDVEPAIAARYPPAALRHFAALRPWLAVEDCRFQHIEPFLDAHELEDLWCYGGEGRVDHARSFAACTHRVLLMGHVHRWELATPDEACGWRGEGPVTLDLGRRWFVAVHAVQQGWCARLDTRTGLLEPIRVGGG